MTAEKQPTPRGSYTWPMIVIGLLVVHAMILFVMVNFAVSDPNFRLVRDETPAAAAGPPAPPAHTLPAGGARP